MGRVQKQITKTAVMATAAAFLIALCAVLVLAVSHNAGASTSTVRDQVRIRDGVVQVYEDGSWVSADSVDAFNAEDPFYLASEKRAEIDATLSAKNAEAAHKAIGSTVGGAAWENVLAGTVAHEAPQEAAAGGNANYYSGGGYGGGSYGGGGWSGGSGGGNSGGGGGSAPSAPSNPSTGQEVLNPWSPDVM